MSQTPNAANAVIGIDIGKNSFRVVGHDERGAIVLQKWSLVAGLSVPDPVDPFPARDSEIPSSLSLGIRTRSARLTDATGPIKARGRSKPGKFPVFFPVSSELVAETSSQVTASSAS